MTNDNSDPAAHLTHRLTQLAKLGFTRTVDGADAPTLSRLPASDLTLDLDDPQARRLGDYELCELLGKGGMGVVYRARQVSLDREVAVKLLAAGPWASDDFIDRFRLEARSAARMQHANIVGIHEIGRDDDLCYFSMDLIRGADLANCLRRQGAFPAAEAAELMRTLAEAVHYAHQLKVLHLDLKPGNILINEETGQPLIADFGLSRPLDHALAQASDEISGTPSYMAPEQIEIRKHQLSAATDIYALGAILYELLTGRPPHGGPDPQRTMQAVTNEEPQRPRRIDRQIPADLEAICLKCLEKDPTARYGRARDLADDLGRFLEHRPVMAIAQASRLYPIRKFIARHRVAVAAASIFFLLVLGSAITTGWLYLQSERNFQGALSAANALVDEVTTELRPLAGTETETVRRILEQARSVYDDLGERPELAVPRARVLRELARAHGNLGNVAQARALIAEAHQLAQGAASDPGASVEAILTLAETQAALGGQAQNDRDFAGAESHYLDALNTLKRDDSDNLKIGLSMADQWHQLALMSRRQGRADEALTRQQAAEAVLEKLDHSDDAVQATLAIHHNAFGGVYFELGRIEDSIEAMRKSLEYRRALADARPTDANRQRELAYGHFQLAVVLRNEVKSETIDHLRQSVKLFKELLNQDPANTRLAFSAARVKRTLAGALASEETGTEEAHALYREVEIALSTLLALDPDNVQWLELHGGLLGDLAGLARDDGRLAEAAGYFSRQIDRERALPNESAPGKRWGLANSLRDLAWVEFRLLRIDAAWESISQGLAIQRPVVESDPNHPWKRQDLMEQLKAAADIGLTADGPQAVQVLLEEAIDHVGVLRERLPDGDDWDAVQSSLSTRLGRANFLSGDFDEAITHLEHPARARSASANYWLGEALLAQGQFELAKAEFAAETCEPCALIGATRVALNEDPERATELINTLANDHGEDWCYEVAMLHALAGRFDAAFEWLERALANGDPGLPNIWIDPRMVSLRAHPRWEQFEANLAP